jgi:hypothetical protein
MGVGLKRARVDTLAVRAKIFQVAVCPLAIRIETFGIACTIIIIDKIRHFIILTEDVI